MVPELKDPRTAPTWETSFLGLLCYPERSTARPRFVPSSSYHPVSFWSGEGELYSFAGSAPGRQVHFPGLTSSSC
jgi:hypothetical protein